MALSSRASSAPRDAGGGARGGGGTGSIAVDARLLPAELAGAVVWPSGTKRPFWPDALATAPAAKALAAAGRFLSVASLDLLGSIARAERLVAEELDVGAGIV